VYHHILVTIDGSAGSDAALEEAIDLAQDCGARLTIVALARQQPWWSMCSVYPVAMFQLQSDLLAAAQACLHDARERVPHDLPVTTILARTSLRSVLRERAASGCYDLIVMGSSRRAPRTRRRRVRVFRGLPVLVVAPAARPRSRTTTAAPSAGHAASLGRVAPR
jgi:nucleotide-binding universal stress UspA family protein